MRITKVKNGHYAKVLSPEFTGVIARIYEEIRQRKKEDELQKKNFEDQRLKADTIASRIATISIRYEEMDTILKRLFPRDESKSYIDRPLEVDGAIKAHNFISTTEGDAPLVVESRQLVRNLNAEYIGGKSVAEFETELNMQAEGIKSRMDARLAEELTGLEEDYAPKAHVGAGGPGVHPYATTDQAGFMSDLDKLKLDKLVISETPPENPKVGQVWIETR